MFDNKLVCVSFLLVFFKGETRDELIECCDGAREDDHVGGGDECDCDERLLILETGATRPPHKNVQRRRDGGGGGSGAGVRAATTVSTRFG